jgi:pimeloyl-ACP methyl ester carboxylesterase
MKRAIMIGGAVSAAAIAILSASQDQIIYIRRSYESHGMRNYYNNLKTNFEAKANRVLLEVSYNSSVGEQTAFWVPPKSSAVQDGSFGKLWLVFGGNAQLALDWLWFIQRLGSDFENDSFLLFDYPGYGGSRGPNSGSTLTLESVGIGAEKVIAMLHENHTSKELDIGILAHSLGCAVGLNYAAQSDFAINHFVLVSPFVSIPRMALALLVPHITR